MQPRRAVIIARVNDTLWQLESHLSVEPLLNIDHSFIDSFTSAIAEEAFLIARN